MNTRKVIPYTLIGFFIFEVVTICFYIYGMFLQPLFNENITEVCKPKEYVWDCRINNLLFVWDNYANLLKI